MREEVPSLEPTQTIRPVSWILMQFSAASATLMFRMGTWWLCRKSQTFKTEKVQYFACSYIVVVCAHTSTYPSILVVKKTDILVGDQAPPVSRAALGFVHMIEL